MSDGAEQPKLIIDSDWKAQAQAEKERLAQQEQAKAAQSGGADADGMPPADFRTLVGMLATQALMYMGAIPDEQGRAMVALDVAAHTIDLLATLAEKTKGNLTNDENEELTEVLRELRSRFVQLTGMVAEARKKQAAGGMPQSGPDSVFTFPTST
ncbi:MAG: DUF1844 domain-containing protein [Phycisphaeraceae bacterium]|nr:DUF1844 domain-containing protein [Phycisphaeraceae bacterium]